MDGEALDIDLVDYHSERANRTMPMIDPSHPDEIVREECLARLGLSVTEGAKVLGLTRQALNNVVNEKAGISPEMAIRLEKAFGSSADMWLRLQLAFELAQARKRAGKISVRRYARPKRAGTLPHTIP